jgi:hypothetical protein
MAKTQLKQKPHSLEIKIEAGCKAVPNGPNAKLSRSQANGQPASVFWYAEVDCCLYLRNDALIPAPPPMLQVDAGNYSIMYTLNPAYTSDSIPYAVRCGVRPCPPRMDTNGDSILIGP